jgi:recA bacterial DNA recombination protein
MSSVPLAHLESLLQARHLDTTVLRAWLTEARAPAASTGLPALDEALGGGWRRGELSELVGPRSSGCTSAMVQTMAAATARGEIVGLVDALDRFDPVSAAATGLDLSRVLWVRGPSCTAERAKPALLERAVHRAIRAQDLLIRAGGFGLVVLDVADVPAVFLRALPMPTWLRLAHAAEGGHAAGLVVGSTPISRSARGATVRLEGTSRWTGDSPQSRRLWGLEIHASINQARRSGHESPHWMLRAS